MIEFSVGNFALQICSAEFKWYKNFIMDFRKKESATVNSPGFPKIYIFWAKFEPFYTQFWRICAFSRFLRSVYFATKSMLQNSKFLRATYIAAYEIDEISICLPKFTYFYGNSIFTKLFLRKSITSHRCLSENQEFLEWKPPISSTIC